jgi:hypothetical protein
MGNVLFLVLLLLQEWWSPHFSRNGWLHIVLLGSITAYYCCWFGLAQQDNVLDARSE